VSKVKSRPTPGRTHAEGVRAWGVRELLAPRPDPHPSTAHPSTAHPSTAHPSTAHPSTAHPSTAHPSTHLSPPAPATLTLVGPDANHQPVGHRGRESGPPVVDDPDVRNLIRAALALDAQAVRAAILLALLCHGVVATWDGLLRPVLRGLGACHAGAGEVVEVEHLLTEVTLGALRETLAVSREAAHGRPVVLACVQHERHCLPLQVLVAGLAEQGLAVRSFGADLPTSALLRALDRTKPALVVLWAQQPVHDQTGLLAQLRAVPLCVAGPGWDLGATAEEPGPLVHLRDLAGAVRHVLHVAG
jgi:hypothetical protein